MEVEMFRNIQTLSRKQFTHDALNCMIKVDNQNSVLVCAPASKWTDWAVEEPGTQKQPQV